MDGATRWQIYTRITLPLIRPTIITAVVMQSMEYFNMVTLIYTLTAAAPSIPHRRSVWRLIKMPSTTGTWISPRLTA